MNPSNYEITTGAAGIDTTRCNFMYGQHPGAWNICDRDKGHYGHHHDGQTGVSWSNTFTYWHHHDGQTGVSWSNTFTYWLNTTGTAT